jgi:O-antigen ligase
MKRKKKDGGRSDQASPRKGDKEAKRERPKAGKDDPWKRGRSAPVSAPARGSSAPVRGSVDRADKSELKRDYVFSMSRAPRLDESAPMHWIQFIPAALFSAVVILLVRQYSYARDMSLYYWSSETAPPPAGENNLIEFFSHYKTELIGWSVLLMGVMLAYRVTVQQFAVKRSALYLPMLVYLLFVFLSFLFSANRDIAWEGWNDRFEGTAMILCYFVGVFFIMNSVNSERNIKFIIYPIAGVSVILSAIGLSQATGHDFFQSTFGQKLLVPNIMTRDGQMPWDLIDQAAAQNEKYLHFTFENNEIYQTVYNINYVSFYLTLLIPLFAMMFIWAKGVLRKSIWGAILGLVVFNFFGAASSGGMLGMVAVVVFVILILRKKLLQWRRSVLIVLAIIAVVGVADVALVDYNGKGVKWTDEFKNSLLSSLTSDRASEEETVKGPGNPEGASAAGPEPVAEEDATGAEPEPVTEEDAAASEGATDAAVAAAVPLSHLDYFITEENTLTFSVDGNEAVMAASPDGAIAVVDGSGAQLDLTADEATKEIVINDERFKNVFFQASQDEGGNNFIHFNIRGDSSRSWPFALTGEDKSLLLFRNDLGKYVSLARTPHIGFENNQGFGSGRGYIWSTSIPMIKDTLLIGHGADTYCVEYPHNDYVGKYNAGWNINMIVDKPHNMYIAVAINTGVISLIALLALFLMYIVQSLRLYWRREFTTFAEYAGAGIFFGVSGFVVSGIVDDSTVSVMPMFYGLLATGIAVNIMLKKRYGYGGRGGSDEGQPERTEEA